MTRWLSTGDGANPTDHAFLGPAPVDQVLSGPAGLLAAMPDSDAAGSVATEPAAAPASWGPALSPDGLSLVFVSDRDGEPRVYVQHPGGEPPVPVETGPEPVAAVSWSPDGSWLACLIAPGGAARTEVWLVRSDSADLHQIAGFGGTTSFFGSWSHEGDWLAVAEADAAGRSAAHLIDPVDGRRIQVGEADLRAALDVTADGAAALVRCGPRSARWLEVVDVASGAAHRLYPADGEGSSDQGHFSVDGRSVYVRTDVGRELSALVQVPIGTEGRPKVLAERADAELEHFVVDADGIVAALLWNVHGGRSDVSLLDLRTGALTALDGLPGEVVTGITLSRDGARLALTAEGPTQPRTVWLVELGTGAVAPVTYPPPIAVLPGERSPELHTFAAHDGLELTGWLYSAGSAGSAGPLVIHLHGGPEWQDRPFFNPLYREIISRGITVFAPNVRGSTGFGRSFENADNREKRFAGIEDVRSTVRYLVEAGFADEARLGVMGRSYGGYLTLAALVNFPELFAAGVDTCGMADLQTFYERTEPWIAAAAISKYGHPDADRELLYDLSPMHRIERLVAPLLVVHGGHDTNVPLYEAEQVVAALEARDAPVQYLCFDDEGHEVLKKPNRVVYVRAVGDFLASHL